MALLKLSNIHCHRGSMPVLKGVDLEVDEGEIRALVGVRGAGKSTLMMAVSGLCRVRRGKILFAGESIRGQAPARIVRAGLCQVPEGRRIFPGLTVAENLEMGAWSRRDAGGRSRAHEMVCDLFPRLAGQCQRLGGDLAPGEQQMLAIARALMARPRLLLLDEPSRGLEPLAVEKIFAVIEKLAGEGIAILLAEENARAALSLADYGYVLADGRIVLAAPARELLRDDRLRQACCGD